MLVNAPHSRLSFIESLELAAPQSSPLTATGPLAASAVEGEVAFVDGSSQVSFVGKLNLQASQDVLNSTLLAQLAANKQYDREIETEAWYGYYRMVLENVGWVIQQFGFSRYNSSGATLELDTAVIAVLRAIMSGDELGALDAALTALQKPENEKALGLFESQSSKSEAGNFQLGTVTVDPNGYPTMSLGAFYFKSNQHKGRFLWVSWSSSSINFYTSAQKVVLNEQIYSTVRQAVIDKLGDNAKTFIDNLEL